MDGGKPVIVDPVGRELGVDDLHVEDAIDLDRDVILRDALLRRDVDRLLLERVPVGHPVEERHEHVETCFERRRVLAQPLDDIGLLLRHDADHSRKDDDRKDKQRDQDACQRMDTCCEHDGLPS